MGDKTSGNLDQSLSPGRNSTQPRSIWPGQEKSDPKPESTSDLDLLETATAMTKAPDHASPPRRQQDLARKRQMPLFSLPVGA
jgi:hypothetical protein